MTLELLAAVVAAVAMAGIGLGLRRMSGGRLPRWFVPVAAGAGLLGFTFWNEYSWYGRVSAKLPPEISVVWFSREGQPLRPWTFVVPLTTRFVALDRREIAVHPERPGLRIATLYSFARWQPVGNGLVAVDCDGQRIAMLVQGAAISDRGELSGADWTQPAPDDRTVQAVCEDG